MSWRPAPVIEWLVREGWRIPNRRVLVDEAVARLLGEGVPLWRLGVYVPTLHPELFGDALRWKRSENRTRYIPADHAFTRTDEYRRSPLHEVRRTGVTFRRRLTGPQARLDYPLLEELAREGCTEYVALPLPFADDAPAALTVGTDAPDGFTDAHIALFEDLAAVVAPIVEGYAIRIRAVRLLDTYVGRDAGERILKGKIQRGSGDSIRAAIWICDLRGFTALSDALPRDALIALLNDWFDAMGDAVERQGGQILKFMGDAMLAIFPVGGTGDAAAAGKALAAARAAGAAMDALNAGRAAPLAFGIALHLGEVMYGNIGTRTRLDFTVIGPAVNLASRIEALCRTLAEPVLLSAAFAAHTPGARPLGRHTMPGLAEPVAVFAPPP